MAAVMAVEFEKFKFVTVIISLCFCIFLPLSEKPVIQPEKGQLSSLLALQVCWQNSGVLDFTWQGSGGHMCGAWSAHACGALVQWSEEFSGSADVQPMPPCVQKNKLSEKECERDRHWTLKGLRSLHEERGNSAVSLDEFQYALHPGLLNVFSWCCSLVFHCVSAQEL